MPFIHLPHGLRRAAHARVLVFLVALAAAFSPALQAQVLTEHQTLLPDAPQQWGFFGTQVAASGDRVAVRAIGATYVFQRSSSGWTRQAKFATSSNNGSAFCLDGDTLLVGQEIYAWTGTAWTLQFTLSEATYIAALQGNTLVVGRSGAGAQDGNGGAEGAVSIYTRTGGTWSLQATVVPPVAGKYEGLGGLVALDGDTFVAATLPTVYTGRTGGLFAFKRAGSDWTFQGRLEVPAGGETGWSLALEGDTAVLADPVHNKLYLYGRSGATWAFAGAIPAPPPDVSYVSYRYFGSEVRLKGGLLAVSSQGGQVTPAGADVSNVHLYGNTTSGWTVLQRFSRAKYTGDTIKIDFDGKTLVVGDEADDTGADGSGAADVHYRPATPSPGGAWAGEDIGAVGRAGSDSESSGTVTISGSGADIWGRSDAFHFRAQTLAGDGTLVARIANPGTGDPWAKAGLMFRADISPSAQAVLAFATPGNHLGLQYRTDTGGETASVDGGWTGFPLWLMLDRQGNVFRAYKSTDGENWTAIGAATAVMPSTVYAGLAVSSHDNDALVTTTFDNVMQLATVPPPPPDNPPAPPTNLAAGNPTSTTVRLTWTDGSADETGFEVARATGGSGAAFALVTTTAANITTFTDSGLSPNTQYTYRVRAVRNGQASGYSNDFSISTASDATPGASSGDIGAVGPAGSTSAVGSTVTLGTNGADIWNAADSFRFYYQPMHGDGTVTARVVSLTNTHPWAKAGVMIRETLAPGAANAAMVLTAGNICGFQTRATAGAATEMVNGPWLNPTYWVRVTRAGNLFSGYVSPDGVTWTLVGSKTLALGADAYAGLAASSHNTSAQATAAFDNISLPGGSAPPPPADGWTQQQWGAATGSVTDGGTVSVTATGDDLWNTADSGVFAWRSWTGDGEFVARVDALTAANAWTKAGLMFRASLDANAANACVALTPANGAVYQGRATAGAATTQVQQNWTPGPGSWLKLVRSGNTVSAFFSTTAGASWTALGTQTITLPATVQVGFAVASHSSSASTTATFSSVTLH